MVKSLSLIFLISAFMVFGIQFPMSKLILPSLGGSSAVWTTTVFFFQGCLFLGYLYSGFITKRFSFKNQITIHGILILLSLFVLFPLNTNLNYEGNTSPIIWVIQTLFIEIGLPFFIISSTSPLLQKWFSYTKHEKAKDPYFLYIASNIGSLLALISYPLLIETTLRINNQISIWRYFYILICLFIISSSFILLRKSINVSRKNNPKIKSKLTLLRKLKWVVLAFIPSSLFLGATTHINTDISSVPAIWILPLAIYLLSFIFAFTNLKDRAYKNTFIMIFYSLSLFILFDSFIFAGWIIPTINILVLLFGICLLLHSQLYKDRPNTEHLTEFYILISLGGVLGSIFNSIIAPAVFDTVIEYKLMIILSLIVLCFCDEIKNSIMTKWKNKTIYIPFILLLYVIFIWIYFSIAENKNNTNITLEKSRSFYGSIKVIKSDNIVSLKQGKAIHGTQKILEDGSGEKLWPLYYPINNMFKTFDEDSKNWSVGVIGLGTGSLICFKKETQDWKVFEIDQMMIDISSNPKNFTYISDCYPNIAIETIDGRMGMQKEKNNRFDLIILDAFLSGNVPAHLVTKEAFELYNQKLNDDGIIAFNASNHFLDLTPVVYNLANNLGWEILENEYISKNGYGTKWLFLFKNQKQYKKLKSQTDYKELDKPIKNIIWEDDFYNIFEILKR